MRLFSAAVLPLLLSSVAAAQVPGTVTEYPLAHNCGQLGCFFPGELAGIAAGPDGALWFTEQFYNTIGRITTSGVITEYGVPTANSQPVGITAGPDGALWFTETQGYPYKIGRISTIGVIAEYPMPIQSGSPSGIAAGPDGALWFTEPIGNKIGRITTSGVITEYAVPTANSQPFAIAAGPDGALWFTESFGSPSKIGRITTAGVITEYDAPTFGGPYGIAVGPDGALWFTEQFSNTIGRITTSGVVTEYNVPSMGDEGVGIATGPDGALWFTEQAANKIGRITTSGVVAEYRVPTSVSYPSAIALGPDGALWFTEYFANNIGRVVAGAAPPPQTGTITINSNLANATFTLTPSASGAPIGGPYPVTLNNVPVGQYSVTFNAVQGYSTPSLPPQTLTVGGTISFNGQYILINQQCSNVSIDQSRSKGLVDVSFLPSTGACSGVLTIRNNKNYWTNFQLSPVGFVTYRPVGEAANLYAANNILPPSGLIGSGTAVQYTVSFASPGDGLSIFVDPTGLLGNGAKEMNMAQILINVLPAAGSAIELLVDDFVVVDQAFAQIPNLNNAAAALFSNPPNLVVFLTQLGLFVTNPTELSTFASLVVSLYFENGVSVLGSKYVEELGKRASLPLSLFIAASEAVGNVIELDFQYSAGSVQLNAQ